MNKYKELVQQRISITIDNWFERKGVEEQELYRFFHNLKGTSGTVGLIDIQHYAEDKLLLFQEDSTEIIQYNDWAKHVYPLIQFFEENQVAAVNGNSSVLDAVDVIDVMSKRILIIDSDIEFTAYLKEVLEKRLYPVSIALTAATGLKFFYDRKPALILLNIYLPESNGIEELKQIVLKAKQDHIPIIVISSSQSKQQIIDAYRAGAMDYLSKPIDPDILLAIIDNRLQMKLDWERSIIIDELTGAYNRKHFNLVLNHLISEYERSGAHFSVVILDLDHFKRVNDTYGHLMGDEVLKRCIVTFQNTIRKGDVLCRYGGEEFVLLLPLTNAFEAEAIVQLMREQFSQVLFSAETESFHVTFSSGISEIEARNTHPEKLVEEADLALYKAKRSGRNQTVIYHEELGLEPETDLHVMIIDDDAIMREIIAKPFLSWQPSTNMNVNVTEFSNGTSFIQSDWYKPGFKYILLLDGAMPGLDGMDVLRQVRNSYPEQDILIIMLTARNNQADIVHALQIGADDYIIKPFYQAELLSRVERLVHRILH